MSGRRGCRAARSPVGSGHERERRHPDLPEQRPRPGPALVGRGQLPDRRPDLPAGQRAAARAAARSSTSSRRLLGHWGTSPGLSMLYALLNRAIRETGTRLALRHRARVTAARRWSPPPGSRARTREVYPHVGDDADGVRTLFRQFSSPGGIPSHVSVQTPGSIHEGGELGYALVARGRCGLRPPRAVVACVVGDGEAETGPLAGSWRLPYFLNPRRDGAVLPILHLNGYKIAGPTVLGRSDDEDVEAYLRSQGWDPVTVAGDDPEQVFPALRAALAPRPRPRSGSSRPPRARPTGRASPVRHPWPAIVLRTPKGWTGPDGRRRQAGRGHQPRPPGAARRPGRQPRAPAHARGVAAVLPPRRALRRRRAGSCPSCGHSRPEGDRRMSATPYANGGRLRAGPAAAGARPLRGRRSTPQDRGSDWSRTPCRPAS